MLWNLSTKADASVADFLNGALADAPQWLFRQKLSVIVITQQGTELDFSTSFWPQIIEPGSLNCVCMGKFVKVHLLSFLALFSCKTTFALENGPKINWSDNKQHRQLNSRNQHILCLSGSLLADASWTPTSKDRFKDNIDPHTSCYFSLIKSEGTSEDAFQP